MWLRVHGRYFSVQSLIRYLKYFCYLIIDLHEFGLYYVMVFFSNLSFSLAYCHT